MSPTSTTSQVEHCLSFVTSQLFNTMLLQSSKNSLFVSHINPLNNFLCPMSTTSNQLDIVCHSPPIQSSQDPLWTVPPPVFHLYNVRVMFKHFPLNHSATETPYSILNTLSLCFPPDSPGQLVFARTLLCCVLVYGSKKCNALKMQVNQKLVCPFKVLFETMTNEPLSNWDPLPHFQHFACVFPWFLTKRRKTFKMIRVLE